MCGLQPVAYGYEVSLRDRLRAELRLQPSSHPATSASSSPDQQAGRQSPIFENQGPSGSQGLFDGNGLGVQPLQPGPDLGRALQEMMGGANGMPATAFAPSQCGNPLINPNGCFWNAIRPADQQAQPPAASIFQAWSKATPAKIPESRPSSDDWMRQLVNALSGEKNANLVRMKIYQAFSDDAKKIADAIAQRSGPQRTWIRLCSRPCCASTKPSWKQWDRCP